MASRNDCCASSSDPRNTTALYRGGCTRASSSSEGAEGDCVRGTACGLTTEGEEEICGGNCFRAEDHQIPAANSKATTANAGVQAHIWRWKTPAARLRAEGSRRSSTCSMSPVWSCPKHDSH